VSTDTGGHCEFRLPTDGLYCLLLSEWGVLCDRHIIYAVFLVTAIAPLPLINVNFQLVAFILGFFLLLSLSLSLSLSLFPIYLYLFFPILLLLRKTIYTCSQESETGRILRWLLFHVDVQLDPLGPLGIRSWHDTGASCLL